MLPVEKFIANRIGVRKLEKKKKKDRCKNKEKEEGIIVKIRKIIKEHLCSTVDNVAS